LETGRGTREITLEDFAWDRDETDKDANFKQQVAQYTLVDPMPTIETLSRSLDIPIGAIVKYILVKWGASGSDGLLELGPAVVKEMLSTIEAAEATGTDQERLAAYRKLSQMLSWLAVPLTDPNWQPGRPRDGA
jgi:hypothetical protein